MPRRTPEFIAYAIQRECALRGGKQPWHPLQAERQLRPLREYCQAIAERRVRQGICLDRETAFVGDSTLPPRGFVVDAMFAAYGGIDWVQENCGACPACAITFNDAPHVAGCFGTLSFPGDEAPLRASVDELLRRSTEWVGLASQFLQTRPRWYGLWSSPRLSPAQQTAHLKIFRELGLESPHPLIERWCATLRSALTHNLEIYVLLVPEGEVQGREWTVSAACARCGAPRPDRNRACHSCGTSGHFTPTRTRLARGDRPFQDLSAFMNSEQLRSLKE